MYVFFSVSFGRELKDEKYKYVDVRPTAPNVTIHGLKSNTPYLFSVMAANEAGGSKYLPDIKKTMAKGEFFVHIFFYFIQIYLLFIGGLWDDLHQFIGVFTLPLIEVLFFKRVFLA